MATSQYNVTYSDGRRRVKLLTAEDAEKLAEQNGVKSVSAARDKQRAPAADKQRSAEADKA